MNQPLEIPAIPSIQIPTLPLTLHPYPITAEEDIPEPLHTTCLPRNTRVETGTLRFLDAHRGDSQRLDRRSKHEEISQLRKRFRLVQSYSFEDISKQDHHHLN